MDTIFHVEKIGFVYHKRIQNRKITEFVLKIIDNSFYLCNCMVKIYKIHNYEYYGRRIRVKK